MTTKTDVRLVREDVFKDVISVTFNEHGDMTIEHDHGMIDVLKCDDIKDFEFIHHKDVDK